MIKNCIPNFIKDGTVEKSIKEKEGAILLYLFLNKVKLNNKRTKMGARHKAKHNFTRLPFVVNIKKHIIITEQKFCIIVLNALSAGL